MLMAAQSPAAICLRRPLAQKSRERSIRGTYRVYAACRVTRVDSAGAARGKELRAPTAAAAPVRALRRLIGAAASSDDGKDEPTHEREGGTGGTSAIDEPSETRASILVVWLEISDA